MDCSQVKRTYFHRTKMQLTLEELQKIFGNALPKDKKQVELFLKWSQELEEENGPGYLEENKTLLLVQWDYLVNNIMC